MKKETSVVLSFVAGTITGEVCSWITGGLARDYGCGFVTSTVAATVIGLMVQANSTVCINKYLNAFLVKENSDEDEEENTKEDEA